MTGIFEEETIQDYLTRFDEICDLTPKDDRSSVWCFELNENDLCKEQQKLADLILENNNDDPEDFYLGCLVFYGYRLGAITLNGKNECFTRQGGYRDKAILKYDTDDLLEYEIEESDDESSVSRLIQWIIDPESNLEIAESVIRKMAVPMINNLSKVTPPGKRGCCKLVLPPVSKDIEISDWKSLFGDLAADEMQIDIYNYGQLVNISDDERHYFFIHQTDGESEYVIISAYELIRGHNTCIGSLAFELFSDGTFNDYDLHDFKETTISINNRLKRYEKKEEPKIVNTWHYVESKYPVSKGLPSFLATKTVSFYREMFRVRDISSMSESRIREAIKDVFKPNEALQADEVCARLLKENNLYNIALGDMAYVVNALQKNNCFVPVLIGTKKHYKLGTMSEKVFDADMTKLKSVPANYATITWRLKNPNRTVKPYFYLDRKKNTLNEIIESIVSHFEHCTTGAVAEELLYIYKNGEDPSALFAVKVFYYLSKLDTIEIESRNEPITSFENVDNVSYTEMDKSKLKLPEKKQKVKSQVTQSNSIFKPEKPINKRKDVAIEYMGFSVRTYNCLSRAGIRTAGDISQKTLSELCKVRNLGKNGVEEVIKKLRSQGLYLRQGK